MIVELEDGASEDDGNHRCATFVVSGQDETWVQVMLGTVNLAYPFPDDPIGRLHRHGIPGLPGLVLDSWQPDHFATFSYDKLTSSREVARFIDRLFCDFLACGPDYPLDIGIEKM